MDYLLGTDTNTQKFIIMAVAILLFVAVMALVLFLAEMPKVPRVVTVLAFLGPAVLLLAFGLVYPAIVTILSSFKSANLQTWVMFDNYVEVFSNPTMRRVLLNTLLWVLLVPTVSTAIGLVYAVLVDRTRFEKLAKTLVFLPMAISMVGAGIIWKFVYEYRGAAQEQIGLLNALITSLGFEPVRFLQDAPLNTFFLIVVMIWIQAGFAMVLLSAAIKAIPSDIVEAARLDGVSPWQMFRNITVPSVRPTLVVVLTTIIIATLKIFDIPRTMTGARFDTQVLANLMYDQSFTFGNNGVGSALAVMIFVLVVPVVVFNVRQMIRNREVRGV